MNYAADIQSVFSENSEQLLIYKENRDKLRDSIWVSS